tara:strand:- start:28 stop:231 length:204 start_codon:yes stop_codon:yes gene_type:complete
MGSYRKSVVNQKELRRLVREKDERMRMGDQFSRRLEKKMQQEVDRALQRARKENRSTLLPRDIDDGN